MAQLTEDEHKARAMLMGREYFAWAHAYADTKSGEPWLNADTLEIASNEYITARIQATLEEEPYADLGLGWGTAPLKWRGKYK